MMLDHLKSAPFLTEELRQPLAAAYRRLRYIHNILIRGGLYTGWQRGRIRLARALAPDAYTAANPFALTRVPAREIAFLQRIRFDKLAAAGQVRDGDWDLDVYPIEEDLFYRACVERFRHGRPWEETDFIRDVHARIAAGKAFWHGCRTPEQVQARCRRIEALHNSLATKGYRRRAEIDPRTWRATFDEITVNIGRDGRLIRNSCGMHRLCLARVLDIEEVPVRVLVRHRAWHAAHGSRVRDPVGSSPPALPVLASPSCLGRPARHGSG